MVAIGRDPTVLWRSPDDWGDVGPELDRWIDEAAMSLRRRHVGSRIQSSTSRRR